MKSTTFKTNLLGIGACGLKSARDALISVLFSAVCLTAFPNLVIAQGPSARDNIEVPLEMLYPELFSLIDYEKWSQIRKTTAIIEPLFSILEKQYSLNIEDSLNHYISLQNSRELKHQLEILVVAGSLELLKKARTTQNPSSFQMIVRQAFKEYLVVEPIFSNKEFRVNQAVMNEYKKAYKLFHNPAEYDVVLSSLHNNLSYLTNVTFKTNGETKTK